MSEAVGFNPSDSITSASTSTTSTSTTFLSNAPKPHQNLKRKRKAENRKNKRAAKKQRIVEDKYFTQQVPSWWCNTCCIWVETHLTDQHNGGKKHRRSTEVAATRPTPWTTCNQPHIQCKEKYNLACKEKKRLAHLNKSDDNSISTDAIKRKYCIFEYIRPKDGQSGPPQAMPTFNCIPCSAFNGRAYSVNDHQTQSHCQRNLHCKLVSTVAIVEQAHASRIVSNDYVYHFKPLVENQYWDCQVCMAYISLKVPIAEHLKTSEHQSKLLGQEDQTKGSHQQMFGTVTQNQANSVELKKETEHSAIVAESHQQMFGTVTQNQANLIELKKETEHSAIVAESSSVEMPQVSQEEHSNTKSCSDQVLNNDAHNMTLEGNNETVANPAPHNLGGDAHAELRWACKMCTYFTPTAEISLANHLSSLQHHNRMKMYERLKDDKVMHYIRRKIMTRLITEAEGLERTSSWWPKIESIESQQLHCLVCEEVLESPYDVVLHVIEENHQREIGALKILNGDESPLEEKQNLLRSIVHQTSKAMFISKYLQETNNKSGDSFVCTLCDEEIVFDNIHHHVNSKKHIGFVSIKMILPLIGKGWFGLKKGFDLFWKFMAICEGDFFNRENIEYCELDLRLCKICNVPLGTLEDAVTHIRSVMHRDAAKAAKEQPH